MKDRTKAILLLLLMWITFITSIIIYDYHSFETDNLPCYDKRNHLIDGLTCSGNETNLPTIIELLLVMGEIIGGFIAFLGTAFLIIMWDKYD